MEAFKEFAIKVQKMRLAQTRYFELIAKARKTKTTDDFNAAKNMLSMSKAMEQEVDKSITEITTA